jgi:hypothetical protein
VHFVYKTKSAVSVHFIHAMSENSDTDFWISARQASGNLMFSYRFSLIDSPLAAMAAYALRSS